MNKRLIWKLNHLRKMRGFISTAVFLIIYVINLVFLYVLTPFLLVFTVVLKVVDKSFWIAKYQFYNLLQYAPQSVRDVIRVYDVKGLKYNESYLNSIRHKVIKMPLEKQSEYVSEAILNFVKNYNGSEHDLHCCEGFRETVLSIPAYELSTAQIADIAYIASHLPASKDNRWLSNDCYNLLAELRNNAD